MTPDENRGNVNQVPILTQTQEGEKKVQVPEAEELWLEQLHQRLFVILHILKVSKDINITHSR